MHHHLEESGYSKTKGKFYSLPWHGKQRSIFIVWSLAGVGGGVEVTPLWGPFHERFFHRYSNSMENCFFSVTLLLSIISIQKFAHDTTLNSTAVMSFAKFHSDTKWQQNAIFIEFESRWKNCSWNGLQADQHKCFTCTDSNLSEYALKHRVDDIGHSVFQEKTRFAICETEQSRESLRVNWVIIGSGSGSKPCSWSNADQLFSPQEQTVWDS